MSNLGIFPAFSAAAPAYPRAIAAPGISSVSSSLGAVAGPSTASGGAQSATQPPAASNTPANLDDADPAAGDQGDQAEQQAQLQRQLGQAEAELLRVMQTEIRELASRDREVRTHEQAHKAVGGQYAGAVSYSYERGPDGRMYAVGGSVAIDTAPVPGDPAATLQKLQQVQRAALAPAQPSAQDLSVAAQAAQAMAQARAELAAETLEAVAGTDDLEAPDADSGTTGGAADKGLAVYRQIGAAESSPGPSVQAQA